MEFNSSEDFLKNESFVNSCLQINEDDVIYWRDYLVKNPDKQVYIQEAATLIQDTQLLLLADKLKPQAVYLLKSYLNKNKKTVKLYTWKYAAIAAAVLVMISAVTFFFYFHQNPPLKPELAKFATHQYFYQAGTQRKAIDLWDGSFIILDKGAKLAIDRGFGKNDRKMYLSGVAYFKVAKDKQHPFKV